MMRPLLCGKFVFVITFSSKVTLACSGKVIHYEMEFYNYRFFSLHVMIEDNSNDALSN